MMRKTRSLLIVLALIASGMLLFQFSSAQSITKPSVPQFSVKFVDASYDVPTTYSTDPYTGETVTNSGYHVKNRTVQVSIKNQPFTKHESDGQYIDFYLDVRMKGHFAKDWINIYSPDNGFLSQSSSEYTTIAYSLDFDDPPFWGNFNQSGVIDFQVEALIGSVHRIMNGSAPDQLSMFPWIFDGEESGWSNIQTISIGESSVSPSPAVPELPSAAVLSLLVAFPLVLTFILRKKSTKSPIR